MTQQLSLRHWLPLLAAVGGLVLLPPSRAAVPPLTDFGYTNMSARFSQPLLVVLANFTNNGIAFLTNGVSIGTNFAAATNYYANWFFNPTNQPESFHGYFRETSNGRFSWTRGGVIMVTLDAQYTHASYAWAGNNQTLMFSSNIMWRALRSGQFNFNSYDILPNDGVVTARELTVVVISDDPTFAGAGARWPGEVVGTNVNWRGAVALCQSDQGIGVIGHEMVHLLQEFNDGHAFDIYGERCLSDNLTIMGCATERLHVDAWHKLQFGWVTPRLVSLSEGGRFEIPAAQSLVPAAPLILYDASGPNGLREYFMVEYRTPNYLGIVPATNYDRNVGGSGMVVWHAWVDSAGKPREYADAVVPGYERDWAMCLRCCGLYHSGSAGRCPSTNTVHASDGPNLIHVLAKNDPFAPGDPNWHRCANCRQLYYHPRQAQSVCPVNSQNHISTGDIYRVPMEGKRDTMGREGYHRCVKCEVLFRQDIYFPNRVCAAGGQHQLSATNLAYAVTTTGARAIMSEGAPDLVLGDGTVWDSRLETPNLRWYAGGEIPVRLRVLPFASSDASITVEILSETDFWVDFAYGGTELGTFAQPYDTFGEGVNRVGYGGTVKIKSGVSTEKGHVDKAMKIEAYGGRVTLGSH